MPQASPILTLLPLLAIAAGCVPESPAPSLKDSAARAGVESAATALRKGDCRLMAIHSHFTTVPLATEDEFERANAGTAGFRDYNGPHLLKLKSAEDEALNALGYAYAEAYNGHVLEHRGGAECTSPQGR